MKLLFVGVFLSCFSFECTASEYHGESYSLGTENVVDEVRVHHHRLRREVVLSNQTDCNYTKCNNTKEYERDHKYYTSQIIKNGKDYWIDVQGNPKSKEHPFLSNNYLRRQNYKLSFQFPYYGHLLDQVMLTTGGFLYMDTHDTRLLTQVQYLAPLMAYFNPHLSSDSKVFTLDDGSKLTVEWYKVHLHENTTDKPFTFQCTLHKNGTIWFAYKEIPVGVDTIPPLNYHPVKVGIADAFVIRYRNILQNTLYLHFYIYSAINITKQSIANDVAVVFKPQPNCVTAKSCVSCMNLTAETNFTCYWCPQTQRCSDGLDRHREEWERNKCRNTAIKEMSEACLRDGVPLTHQPRTHTSPPSTPVSPSPSSSRGRREGTLEKRESKNKGIGGAAIFGICLVLIFIIAVAAWCVYAYKQPTSKSGLFLIEKQWSSSEFLNCNVDATRRPREFFRRSPGVSGNARPADPSDVKPQVL